MPLDQEKARRADPRGAYYTPAHIVSLMVENTLGRLCDEGVLDQRCPTILDPSCGDGGFLVGAYTYLLGRRTCSARRRLLSSSIYGVDIDASALDSAARRLIEASGDDEPIDLSANLLHRDSLLYPGLRNGRRPPGIDWREEFPCVMERGGFDVVIGNPPWVSLTGRFGIGAYTEAEIEYLRRRFGGSSYMPNTFEYFIHLGFELTRPGGYFSFVVPDRLGYNSQLARLRQYLLSEGELVTLVRGVRFSGVVADALIFVIRKKRPNPDSRILVSDFEQGGFEYPQAGLTEHPDCAFRIPQSSGAARVIERMESLPGRLFLGDVCSSTSGFGGRSQLITEERISDAQIPVLKGSSVSRYCVHAPYWFEFRRENITGRTVDTKKLGASPKILVRKTGTSLIAAYDASGMYPEQSLYFLYNSLAEMDLRFILGILNSRLMNLYYRATCLTNSRSIAHVKKLDLDRIPLPPTKPEQHDRMVYLVDRLLRLHERADEESIRSAIEATDRLVDELVFELYSVDSREIF